MTELESYTVEDQGVTATVVIGDLPSEFVKSYTLEHAKLKGPTRAVLGYLKEKIIESVNLKISEIMDPRQLTIIRERVSNKARELVRTELGGLSPEEERIVVGRLLQEMLGLGEIDLLLSDFYLEEIVINSAGEPIWVYHIRHGWLKTNVRLESEEQIHNYASIIGRRVGKQITNLDPLMDAHLLSGDRVNATLFPISTKGNSITIRKFAKDPWTIVSLIANNTLSSEAAATFWTALQYEMNVLIGGGTASGKTSFLNSVLVFTPPNQRLISIEDSVSGDAEIFFERDGTMQRSTVAGLIDALVDAHGTVLPDGAQVALNPGGIKVHSMASDGVIQLVEPSCFIRHHTSKKLFEVSTAGGASVKVTADHSLFTRTPSGEIVAAKTNELCLGQEIATFSATSAASASPAAQQIQLVSSRKNAAQWSPITKIAPLPISASIVYDFSVPANESFVANGVVCHNTRELQLPDFLHWTPLSTRQPNPEGKGGVEMLDLMTNSLRMRPDRIVLGEIRRQREAEVLFEAMHTGHSVYSTLHADDASQVKNRLTSPPISLPEQLLGALHLVAVQYRQRRIGIRRTFEIAEILPSDSGASVNIIYKWDARKDQLVKVGEPIRFMNELVMHTGFTQKEVVDDIAQKQLILESMQKAKIGTVEDVGRVVAAYYRHPENVVELAEKGDFSSVLYR